MKGLFAVKISTSLKHAEKIAGATVRESARMMKTAGFDGVDLSMCEDHTKLDRIFTAEWAQNIKAQCADLQAEGLELAQCHLAFYPGHVKLPGDGSYQTFEDLFLPVYIRMIEICGEIECPVAVMHPFFDADDAQMTRDGNLCTIEKLLPLLRKHGVKLALENIYGHNGRFVDGHVARPEGIMAILERCDADWVGACIDTGHANIFHENIGRMARMYGNRLFALHVNGNAGDDEHAIPYTLGWCENMDFHDFSAALKEIGYKGYYNLEINPGNLPASAAQPYLNLAGSVARALADLAE